MKTLVASKDLSTEELVRRNDELVVLVKGGRPVALVSRLDEDDLDWLEQELDPAFIASLAKARQQIKQGRTRSLAVVKAELGIVID
jgi:hypothetical protein